MSKRRFVDTSILIGLYNEGLFEEKFLELNQRGQLLFSVVTINEFVRGARDKTSKEIVKSFLEIVGDNLITPTEEEWMECGTLSEHLLKGKRKSKQEVLLLQNDILIALGAKEAEAVLVTADKKDFILLKELVPVSVEFW